jgi:hypothetical protein
MKHLSPIGVKALGLATVAATLIVAIAPPAMAAQNNSVVLSPETVIPVKLTTRLSSNKSHKGDNFSATVDDSKGTYRAIMHGGIVVGVVQQAVPKKGKNPGILDLSFTQLRLPDGRRFNLAGTPTSLNAKYITTNRNGVMVAKNTVKNQRLKYAGVGAGSAALVKVLGGNKVKIKDLLIGGGLGYAAGSIIKGSSRVNDVDLAPGTRMGVLLGRSVKYAKVATRNTGRRR